MEVPGKASVPMDGPDTSTQRESGIGLGSMIVTLSLPGMDLDQISGDPRKCFNLGPEYFVSKFSLVRPDCALVVPFQSNLLLVKP